MYISPINITHDIKYEPPIEETIGRAINKAIYKALIDVNVKVSREELIKAMQYDRNQYEKGYEDGKNDAVKHGHWNLSAGIADSDDGNKWVHVNATCSRCGFGWRDYTAVITDYFDSSDYPITDELIRNRKEKSLKLAWITLRECSHYCEKCGAKMDEKEKEQ